MATAETLGGSTLKRSKSRSDQNLCESYNASASMQRSVSGTQLAHQNMVIPEVTEERVGIIVSKKGYMNFLEEKTQVLFLILKLIFAFL